MGKLGWSIWLLFFVASIAVAQTPPVLKRNPTGQTPAKTPPVLDGDGQTQTQTAPPAQKKPETVQDDEVIRVETDLVTMPVTVLDRNGRFVAGLRQGDFEVYEDGVAQKIEYFAPVEQPFTVELLIDVSNSTAFKIDEIQSAALAFIDQLRRDDRVIIVTFDEEIRVLNEPTSNRYVLRQAISQLRFDGGTKLYEAVDFTFRRMNSIEGRKAVVLFTDGVDTSSKYATYKSTLAEAEESDCLIYPIRYDTYSQMRGQNGGYGTIVGFPFPFPRRRGGIWIPQFPGGRNGSSREEYRTGQNYLNELAQRTGGRAYEARDTTNLGSAFRGIAEELRQQYSLGYYPATPGQRGQRKQIKVKVNRPEVAVRAKTSYTVGETTAQNSVPRPSQPRYKTSRLPF
jgi:VWFA-related protein